MPTLPPVLAGQPITAEWANQLLDEVRRLRRISAGPGLHLLQNEAGLQIGLCDPGRLWLFENFEFNPGGITEDGVRYWQAMRLRTDSSQNYQPDRSDQFTLYDPLGLSTQSPGDHSAPEKTRHWATFNADTDRWEIVGARTALRYAKLTTPWRFAVYDGYRDWTVLAHPCQDATGVAGVDADTTLTINLPAAAFGHPNLVADQVILYQEASDGLLWCVSPFLDDPISTLKPCRILGLHGQGWGLADGSANSEANGGSGINLVDRFVRGVNYEFSWGVSGGSDTHSHDPHDASEIDDHPAGVTDPEADASVGVVAGDATAAAFHHTHATPPLSHTGSLTHASASNVPAYTGVLWIERLNNGVFAV